MTLTDSFLQLMRSQGAHTIVLQRDKPPLLRSGSDEKSLSMPPLDSSTLEQLLSELDVDEGDPKLDAGGLSTSFAAASGAMVKARVHKHPNGLSVTLGSDASRREEPSAASSAPPPAKTDLRPRPALAVAPAPESTASPAEVVPLPEATRDVSELRRFVVNETARGATDIILSSGLYPRSRVGTALTERDILVCDDEDILSLALPSLSPAVYANFLESGNADIGLELDGERYRGGLFRQHRGLGLALRPVRTQIPTLRELGLPRAFADLVKPRHGLVLMTGATGSGKSSTLAALIGHLNETTPRHVITLEDPIEFVHPNLRCLVHQREIGRDVDSFASGLRASLRENPDVILVGEIRDVETAVATLRAAETGHLVLATLHSRSSDTAIERLIDLFPEHQQGQARMQVASVLRSVVSQVLLAGRNPGELVVAYERLVNNVAVSAKIRDGRWHQIRSEIMKGRADGMISMESCLAELVRQGRLRAEQALECCDTAEMRSQLGVR